MRLAAPCALIVLCTACIPPSASLAMLAPAAEPVPMEDVRVIDGSQTGDCTAIAQLEEPVENREQAFATMRQKAGEVGANALVLGEVRDQVTTGNRILWGGLAGSDEIMNAIAYRCDG